MLGHTYRPTAESLPQLNASPSDVQPLIAANALDSIVTSFGNTQVLIAGI